jgi:glycogen debranching enzyme
MAASPAFISTPRIDRVSLSTANTATDGTGTISDLIVGASAGTRILSVNVQGTATTVASLVNLFLYDGTNWDLFDQVTISATTGSNTVKGYRLVTAYTDLVLPSASWKLGATITVAPTTGTVRVLAFGGDLT